MLTDLQIHAFLPWKSGGMALTLSYLNIVCLFDGVSF
jgi:hypothetical protein